jgi:hypothetical protein
VSPLVRAKMPQDRQIHAPSNLGRMDRLPVRPHCYVQVNGQVVLVDLDREVLLDTATISTLVDSGAQIAYVEEREG